MIEVYFSIGFVLDCPERHCVFLEKRFSLPALIPIGGLIYLGDGIGMQIETYEFDEASGRITCRCEYNERDKDYMHRLNLDLVKKLRRMLKSGWGDCDDEKPGAARKSVAKLSAALKATTPAQPRGEEEK